VVLVGEVEVEEEEEEEAEECRWTEDRFRPCSRMMPLKDSRCFWCKSAVVRQEVGDKDGEGSLEVIEIEVEGEDEWRKWEEEEEEEEGRISCSPSAKAVGMKGREGEDRSYALWERRRALWRSASAACDDETEGDDAGDRVAIFAESCMEDKKGGKEKRSGSEE
jgi:hypothetical protein